MAIDRTARIIEVANAIVADLNSTIAIKLHPTVPGEKVQDGAAIERRFEAVRKYRTLYRYAELSSLRVDVGYMLATNEEESKGHQAETMPLEILIQKAVSDVAIEAIDDLVNLSVRIALRYPTTLCPCQGLDAANYPAFVSVLGDGSAIQCVENEHLIYDPLILMGEGNQGQRYFMSRINLTWHELGIA